MVNSNTNILSDIFVDYDSLMFQGLDLNIRLYV